MLDETTRNRRIGLFIVMCALALAGCIGLNQIDDPSAWTRATPATTTTTATTTSILPTGGRTESRSAPRTTLNDERDFDNCVLLNETMLAIVDDYFSGQTDAHTGLASARIALSTMKGLDCGRFSSVVAREMANMDRALRSVGY